LDENKTQELNPILQSALRELYEEGSTCSAANVILTFKSLSEEKPPLCVTTKKVRRSIFVCQMSEYVLVADSDAHFMIARLERRKPANADWHSLYWSERETGLLIDDLDKWSTWAYLPTEADGD